MVVFHLIYIVANVLIKLLFFLIAGFVSENVLSELIVHDNFLILQLMFLSSPFFSFSFSFYKVYSVCLDIHMGIPFHVCEYIFGSFSFPLIIFLSPK